MRPEHQQVIKGIAFLATCAENSNDMMQSRISAIYATNRSDTDINSTKRRKQRYLVGNGEGGEGRGQ